MENTTTTKKVEIMTEKDEAISMLLKGEYICTFLRNGVPNFCYSAVFIEWEGTVVKIYFLREMQDVLFQKCDQGLLSIDAIQIEDGKELYDLRKVHVRTLIGCDCDRDHMNNVTLVCNFEYSTLLEK